MRQQITQFVTGGGPVWTVSAVVLTAVVLGGMALLAFRFYRSRKQLPQVAGREALASTVVLGVTTALVITCATCSLASGVPLWRPLTILLLLNGYQVWAYALSDAGFIALVEDVKGRARMEKQLRELRAGVLRATDQL